MTRTINGVLCRNLEIGEAVRTTDVFSDGLAYDVADVGEVETFGPDDILCLWRPVDPQPSPTATGIEAKVCQDIAERQRKGIAKYTRDLHNNPHSMREMVQHMYEELLDAAIYCRETIDKLDNGQDRTIEQLKAEVKALKEAANK